MQNSLRHLLLLTFLLADLRRPTSPWDDRSRYIIDDKTYLAHPDGGLNLLCSPLPPSVPALCGANLALVGLTLMGILSLPLRYIVDRKKDRHQSKSSLPPTSTTDQESTSQIPPGVRPQECVPGEGGGKRGLSLLLILCAIGVVGMLLIMAGDVEQNPGPPKRQAPPTPRLRVLDNLRITNWRSVGLNLGLEDSILNCIQADHAHYPCHTQRCGSAMFSAWLNSSTSPMYTQVVEALVSAGEDTAAEELSKEYGIPLPVTLHVPECLVQYSKYLKERYRAMSVFPEGEWPPSIGNRYIQLALIKHQEKFPDKESTRVISEGCLLGRIDRIVAQKQEIKLPEVFQPDLDEEGKELPLRVLVDGAPGVGKTTLCLNVCKDWTDHKLLVKYHLVVLLQLRQEELDSVKSLRDIFYYPDPKLQDEVVSTIVQSGGEGVLVILDGFDELTHEQRRKSVFMKLISGQLLPKCSVIVTSRPYASEQLQQLKCIRKHVEVLGFTDYQIKECIKQQIPDKEKGRQLAKLVEERQDLALFCYIPLNCAILLFVYKMENYTLPRSLTHLFTLFIVNTLKRDARLTYTLGEISDLDDLPSPIQDTFDHLCTMAYNGLLKGHLVFTTKTLKHCIRVGQPAGSQLLGLMTATKSFTSVGEDISYQFLHLTIQEFLAARYVITKLSPEEQVTFFRQNILDDRFRVTLVFMAGLSQLQHSGYAEIFCCSKITLPETEQDNSATQWFLFLTHLLYESQNSSLCVTLASAFGEKTITLNEVKMTVFNCMTLCYFLLRSGCKWRLNLGSCRLRDNAFEMFKSISSECSEHTGGVQALKIYTEKCFEFSIKRNTFSPLALLLIPLTPLFHKCCEIVLHNPSVFWAFGCFPPESEYCLSNLLNMTHLTHLEIVDLRQHDQAVVFSNLAKALLHNKTLTSLYLSNCGPVRKQAFQHISIALGSASLKSLTLRNLGIRSTNAIVIFKAVQLNGSLESLDVSGNLRLLEGDTRVALMDLMKNFTTLRSLNLSDCGLTGDDFMFLPLFHSLSEKSEAPPSLQKLHVDGYTWTPSNPLVVSSCPTERIDLLACRDYQKLYEFILHVCAQKTLHQCCQHLRHLDFCHSPLARERKEWWLCDVIGYLLAHSSVIESLNLSHCRLDDDGVRCIIASLQRNSSIKSLNVSHNNITCGNMMFEALQQNRSLESLDVRGNLRLLEGASRVALMDVIKHSTTLRSLNLSNCGLTNDEFAIMFLPLLHSLSEKSEAPPSLQELHVDGYTWTPSNPPVVSSCPTERLDLLTCRDYQKVYEFILHVCAQKTPHQCCEHLRHLDFSHSLVARERVRWLCAVIGYLLAHSSVIESLNLSHCELDDNVRFIASGLKQNSSLRMLNISHNHISDYGAEIIVTALQENSICTLKSLDMTYNRIRNPSLYHEVVEALQHNHCLETLKMDSFWYFPGSRYERFLNML